MNMFPQQIFRPPWSSVYFISSASFPRFRVHTACGYQFRQTSQIVMKRTCELQSAITCSCLHCCRCIQGIFVHTSELTVSEMSHAGTGTVTGAVDDQETSGVSLLLVPHLKKLQIKTHHISKMHELFSPDSEFHTEKNELSQHLMILSIYISLQFAKNAEEEKALLLLKLYQMFSSQCLLVRCLHLFLYVCMYLLATK